MYDIRGQPKYFASVQFISITIIEMFSVTELNLTVSHLQF